MKDAGSRPEILFLQRDDPATHTDSGLRSTRVRSTQEAHVAFPGGRTEEGDEGGLYTGMSHRAPQACLNLMTPQP